MEAGAGYLRIGELSRRTGVAPELLRAWERRYGLLRPARSAGGFRLYSEADERRVELMRAHLRDGLAAAEAAKLALDGGGSVELPDTDRRPELDDLAERMKEALDAFDEGEAQRVIDRLLGTFTTETVLSDVILPYLRDLGERWSSGEATIGQEHFASNIIRGRLLGLVRGWDVGEGKRALLACAPGELHDLGLIAFGVALRRHGWRIVFLGPDTPADTIVETAERLEPQLVVVTGTTKRRLTPLADVLRSLGAKTRVAIAGAGASDELAGEMGIERLNTNPVTAAANVA